MEISQKLMISELFASFLFFPLAAQHSVENRSAKEEYRMKLILQKVIYKDSV